MVNQVLYPPSVQGQFGREVRVPNFLAHRVDTPWWQSLKNNLRDVFFPEKQAPLHLTSRPVQVRSIWGAYDNKRSAAVGSMIFHAAVIGGVIGIALMPPAAKVVKAEAPKEVVSITTPPDLINKLVPMQPKPGKTLSGGGGGGDHDKIQAPQGKLPKPALEQITPPAMVIRNDNPKLAVEPTVVMPPDVKIAASANLPKIGDPLSKIAGPSSNGVGAGAGIGSGKGGGIGSGIGGGVGPGTGGGFGGGVFSIGNGVTAPVGIFTPDPEFTEEARKAKYQGTVVLALIVDASGNPKNVKVARTLGMGLDERAVQTVRTWRFEPAKKDGRPVAVQMNVEVAFRLY